MESLLLIVMTVLRFSLRSNTSMLCHFHSVAERAESLSMDSHSSVAIQVLLLQSSLVPQRLYLAHYLMLLLTPSTPRFQSAHPVL